MQTRECAKLNRHNPVNWALDGGDDFELLVALDPDKWKEAVANDLSLSQLVHIIGEADGSGMTELKAKGWNHFPALK